MAWIAFTSDLVLDEFTPSEKAQLNNIQGATHNLAAICGRVIAEIRDAIQSSGQSLDSIEGTLPEGLHSDAISIARWRWLVSIPQAKQMQTVERSDLYKEAKEKLKAIAAGDYKVTPTDDATTPGRGGSWNSENKILMRTHPVPRPDAPGDTDFANE